MGSSASAENREARRASRQGFDPHISQQRIPVIPHQVSRRSLVSRASRQSLQEAIDDELRLAELKAELEAHKKRLAFLENIRSALVALDQDSDSENEEEEGTAAPVEAEAASGQAATRGLRKVDRFAMDQLKRKTIRRIREAPSIDREPPQWSTTLEGEDTRAWKNAFAGRLALMRKFYDWDEIPMDFFVDKQIAEPGEEGSRSRLSARLSERRSVSTIREDNKDNIRNSLKRGALDPAKLQEIRKLKDEREALAAAAAAVQAEAVGSTNGAIQRQNSNGSRGSRSSRASKGSTARRRTQAHNRTGNRETGSAAKRRTRGNDPNAPRRVSSKNRDAPIRQTSRNHDVPRRQVSRNHDAPRRQTSRGSAAPRRQTSRGSTATRGSTAARGQGPRGYDKNKRVSATAQSKRLSAVGQRDSRRATPRERDYPGDRRSATGQRKTRYDGSSTRQSRHYDDLPSVPPKRSSRPKARVEIAVAVPVTTDDEYEEEYEESGYNTEYTRESQDEVEEASRYEYMSDSDNSEFVGI
mmetsp:Transcript_10190/g.11736  ORF Transcript_10190/g.11736 Transcript_10190/m.11736 type:complete len:527 (+) Transcript_10190:338-1918(+)